MIIYIYAISTRGLTIQVPEPLLRKAKQLQFTSKIQKISDLKPFHLAAVLARQHDILTEQAIMLMGGELWVLRTRAVNTLKMSDNEKALEVRLKLCKEAQDAERRWRERMLQILDKSQG